MALTCKIQIVINLKKTILLLPDVLNAKNPIVWGNASTVAVAE